MKQIIIAFIILSMSSMVLAQYPAMKRYATWDNSNNQWQFNAREFLYFNSNLKPDSIVGQISQSSTWENYYLNTYKFNTNQDLIERNVFYWLDSSSEWIQSNHYIRTYDNQNRLDSFLSYQVQSGNNTLTYYETIKYSPSNSQKTTQGYLYDNNIWELFNVDTIFLNSNGFDSLNLDYRRGFFSGNIEHWKTWEYEYYAFDSIKKISVIDHGNNSYNETDYFYNANNYLDSIMIGSGTTYFDKTEYSYNNQNQVLSIVDYIKVNNNWANNELIEFSSTIQTLYTSFNRIDLMIFPNPVNDKLHLKWHNKNELNYSLYNLKGQEIQSGAISNERIDLSKISPGEYVVTVYDKSTKLSKKIIKIE